MLNKESIVADIVVVGYGLAGATAAIVARDAGAEVVLLEKSAKFGGDSILSGGGITYADDEEKALQYLTTMCGQRTGEEVIRAQVKMMAKTGDFLGGLCKLSGARLLKRNRPGIYPFPGREGINSFVIEDVPGFTGYPWLLGLAGGARLMKVFDDNVTARKITVMTSTTARELLRDHSGEIIGLIAEREGKTLAQLAISWVLRRPEVTSAIAGARKPEQILETAPASDWNLSKNDIEQIEQLLADRQAQLNNR